MNEIQRRAARGITLSAGVDTRLWFQVSEFGSLIRKSFAGDRRDVVVRFDGQSLKSSDITVLETTTEYIDVNAAVTVTVNYEAYLTNVNTTGQ